MNEAEFSKSIDCAFPYANREKVIELVDVALSISTNAVFMVLEEICRPPQSTGVAKETLSDLIDVWSERVDHPLARSVVPIARLMLEGTHLSVYEAEKAVRKIAPFEGQYSALNIAYFSCDDTDGSVETVIHEVRGRWEHS
ncbi:hypothetical protein [Ruegeria lacuscaerulensis]|uniref:hypothetical protein n=1 Tax=Ruegeria lacuscaerulensis TaxID=55218 RepID=UPI00147B7EB8|nr:hypothetical protein [Ruegeria lacuscaerulensis]